MKMNLSPEGMDVLARCISRGEHLTLETKPIGRSELRCEDCNVDSAAEFALSGISTEAVYDLGTVWACCLCDTDKVEPA